MYEVVSRGWVEGVERVVRHNKEKMFGNFFSSTISTNFYQYLFILKRSSAGPTKEKTQESCWLRHLGQTNRQRNPKSSVAP